MKCTVQTWCQATLKGPHFKEKLNQARRYKIEDRRKQSFRLGSGRNQGQTWTIQFLLKAVRNGTPEATGSICPATHLPMYTKQITTLLTCRHTFIVITNTHTY